MTKKLTPKQIDNLAVKFINFLQKHDLFCSVNIYANNKLLSDSKTSNSRIAHTNLGAYYITNNVNTPVDYNNPETITVTFEGDLYDIINYAYDSKLYKELTDFFSKYNLYFEQGYPWSFALYYL